MAKPSSSSRFVARYFNHIASKPPISVNPTTRRNHKPIQNPSFSSWLLNPRRTHFPSNNAKSLQPRNYSGFRCFSYMNQGMGSRNFAKNLVNISASSVKNAFARYNEAVAQQIKAFWKRNYVMVLGAAGGFGLCILVCQLVKFGIAVACFESMAMYVVSLECCALALSLATATCLYALCLLTVPAFVLPLLLLLSFFK